MKNYEQERKFNYTKTFTLDKINRLLQILAFPQNSLKIIHIAGTKGKTSTSFYLSSMLRICGVAKIGIYTSPHIESPTERIKINQENISLDDMNHWINQVIQTAQRNNLDISYFEMMTTVAFLYFQDKKVNLVILETGLGGRLDATNVTMPLLTIITRIDRDHEQILGKNLFKIAYEKMGIVKKNIPYLLSTQSFWVRFFCRILGIFKGAKQLKPLKFKINTEDNFSFQLTNEFFQIQFKGPFYALENFILALSAVNELSYPLPAQFEFEHSISGRFEMEKNGAGTILWDGSHNPISAKMLSLSIKKYFGEQKFITIFNCFPDKNFLEMIPEYQKFTSLFILPELENFATDDIADYFKHNKINYQRKKIIDIQFIKDNYYCVTGSFYLIGDLKKHKIQSLFI